MSDDDRLARIEAQVLRGNELLARIDEHLERGIQDFSPEHLARGAEFAAQLDEHLERSTEAVEASVRTYEDWRFAGRQDSLRNERILGEISQSLARNTQSVDRHGERIDRHLDRLDRRTDEIIAEGKAQRAALWKLLDRLPGPDGPEPAPG